MDVISVGKRARIGSVMGARERLVLNPEVIPHSTSAALLEELLKIKAPPESPGREPL
jgi:hypothetical protein